MVVEIDGSIHNNADVKEQDIKRENDLKEWGYLIIRFTNERVIKETDKVLEEIEDVVENLLNQSSVN